MEERNEFVRMETSKGTMTVELYGARVPKTVERFMTATNAGKYDGLKFLRIIKDFTAQGGDPQGTGMGGGNVKFEGSDVKHVPGVISMLARQARVDQSDMQFFIMTSTSDQLDGNYTAFGHVTEGMDVLGAIAATPVAQAPWGERSRPVEDVHIVKASEILD
jgi:cyclophilin family peptidyl-prolyl cis-trans isomerase